MNTYEVTLLFDTYGSMLTRKQWEYMDMRYNQDMTLSEIALLQDVSRQAVFDNLVRTETRMRIMEEKIGCVRREHAIQAVVAKLGDVTQLLDTVSDPNAAKAIAEIKQAVALLKE